MLFKLRKHAKLTQRELARAMKVDFTYVSKIENGGAPPPHRDRIEMAARAVKATPDQTAELFRLAEKLPQDVSQFLATNASAMRLVRRIRTAPVREQAKILDKLIQDVEDREKARKKGPES